MLNSKFSRWLFLIFIFLLPFQTRFILFSEKPEFLGFSIYFSEFFLWTALTLWLIESYKKIKLPLCHILFLFFCFATILWAPDKISAFRIWLYIFEGMLIFEYLKCSKDMRAYAIKTFLISLFFISCFAIWQFFNLGSPASKWLGLANRGAWNLGDIVIGTNLERWLRAYGTFPHPNILGGFLATGMLLLAFFIKQNASKVFAYPLGAIFIFSLFLTFSRSAWLGFAIAFLYFSFKNFNNKNIRKFFSFSAVLIIILSFIFWPLISPRIKSKGYLENKSNIERVASWKEGLGIWAINPIFGTGLGNYTGCELQVVNCENIEPSHNIFLIVLAELGIFGFLLYLFFWRKLWKNGLQTIFILFFIIGLFDHYLWTLYSGQMLFWVGASLFIEQN